MNDLQRRVGEWGQATFPGSTWASILKHLNEEWQEFSQSSDPLEMMAEAADMIMLLFHLAHRCGISLENVIEAKFALCQKSEWTEPDARGYSKRKKPDAPAEAEAWERVEG